MRYLLWYMAPGKEAVPDTQHLSREAAIRQMRWLNKLYSDTNRSNRYYIEKVY